MGVAAVKAFHSLLANAMVPLGPDGEVVPAINFLVTLRGLYEVLFEGCSISDFVNNMRKECRFEDPAETLLSPEVQDGLAFIPTLLVPDAVAPARRGEMRKNLSEPFLSDDKLAAVGIDVTNMDKFRTAYQAFRAGEKNGASGEPTIVASAVKPSTPTHGGLPQDSRNASRMKRTGSQSISLASTLDGSGIFSSSW